MPSCDAEVNAEAVDLPPDQLKSLYRVGSCLCSLRFSFSLILDFIDVTLDFGGRSDILAFWNFYLRILYPHREISLRPIDCVHKSKVSNHF